MATDPVVRRWHVVTDNLSTHKSIALVRIVAELSGVRDDLGIPGTCGILHTRHTPAAFLSDPHHPIVFHAYYNRTMAKPFKWTYHGMPLAA